MTVFHGLSAFSITPTDQAGVVDAPAWMFRGRSMRPGYAIALRE